VALTLGQKLTLFLLVSSRSEFRFGLEGRAAGSGTANPAATQADFVNRLNGLVPSIGIAPADLAAINANTLWVGTRHVAGVPDRQIASVTTDHNEMIAALGLDNGLYLPDNPCPGGAQQVAIAKAVNAIP